MVSGKVFCKKAFEIASNQKYDGYHTRIMVYKCFDKKARDASTHTEKESS